MINYFNENYYKYDNWYVLHEKEFNEQLNFLKSVLPKKGNGVEIGVGSGRFAGNLGIFYGVDLSYNLLKIAKMRGINSIMADAVHLPFKDDSFDFSLFMVTLCFLSDPLNALLEAKRISGRIFSVIIDKDSEYIEYIRKYDNNGFYKYATFYSKSEVIDLYKKTSINIASINEESLISMGKSYTLISIEGIKYI
ncbi:MAG: class I SAM-dependent methyltransferase [Thermoplasmata archaeon]